MSLFLLTLSIVIFGVLFYGKTIKFLLSAKKIKNFNKTKFGFNLLQSKYAFAFSTIGKEIFVSTKLLEVLDNDQLNLILRHEKYHIARFHPLKQFIVNVFSLLIMVISAMYFSVVISLFINILLIFISLKISRFYEFKADHFAVRDEDSFKTYVQSLKILTHNSFGDFVPEIFRPHPSLNTRITGLDKRFR